MKYIKFIVEECFFKKLLHYNIVYTMFYILNILKIFINIVTITLSENLKPIREYIVTSYRIFQSLYILRCCSNLA